MDQIISEIHTLLEEPAPGDALSQERVSESGDSLSRTQTTATAPGDPMSQERSSQNSAQEGVEKGGGLETKHNLNGAEKRKLKKLLARGVPYASAIELCRKTPSSPGQGTTSDPARVPDSSQGAEDKRPQKRDRSEETSPKENPRKTTRLEDPAKPSFRDVTSAIKIGVKDKIKKLSDSDLGLVQASILARIDVEAAKGGSGPRFVNCQRRDGWLCISCVNEHSRDWLISRVGLLEPWKGAKLTTMSEKDFPRPYIGSIWVPGPVEDPKLILSRIIYQNSHMDCSGWRLMRNYRVDKGQYISFYMPRASYEELQRNGMSVSMGFNPITVRVKLPKTSEPTGEPMETNVPNVPPTAPPGSKRPPNLSPTAERRAAPSTTPFRSGNADAFDPQVPGPSGLSRATAGDISAKPSAGTDAQAVAGDPAVAPRLLGVHRIFSGARFGPADIRERPPLRGQGLGSAHLRPMSPRPNRGATRGGRGRGAYKAPTVRKPTQPKALGPPKK